MDGKTGIIVAAGIVAVCLTIDSFSFDYILNIDDASFYSMLKYGLVMPNVFLIIGAMTKFSGPNILWMVLNTFNMVTGFVSWVVIPMLIFMYQDTRLIKEVPVIMGSQLAFTVMLTIITSRLGLNI